jgi:hypothetical protein
MSSPKGEVFLSPLPGCVIRVGLGGAVVGVLGFLFGALLSFFSFESFTLAADVSSLVTYLVAVAPKHSCSDLCPIIAEKDSELRGRGRGCIGST